MPLAVLFLFFFFFNDTATTEIYTLSLHDALPISGISADDVARVPPRDGGGGGGGPPGVAWTDVALADALDQFERTLIARALSATQGNVAEAARRLSTDRANLYRRMRRLGLEPPRNVAG